MRKSSVIILSWMLICFIVALSCALAFTYITPDKEVVAQKYIKAGYKYGHYELGGGYSIRSFTKDDRLLFVIWYGNKELAEKSFVTACETKGDRYAVKRGNAIAVGYEKDMRIFQFA